MTRMRMPTGLQSFTAAQELVEDIRKNRETAPTGAVSFVNYYNSSNYYYQTTTVQQSLTGLVSWNGRTNVVVPATNDYMWSQISVIDDTTGDVSTSKHGLVPKATGSTTNFLRADATYAAPAGGGAAGTMYFLASATVVGADASSIVFSGLTGSNYYIQGMMAPDSAGGSQLYITFNGDAGNNYTQRGWTNNGSAFAFVNASAQASGLLAYVITGVFQQINLWMSKPLAAQHGGYWGHLMADTTSDAEIGGRWVSTSDKITSITLDPESTIKFKVGTTLFLYGDNT